MSSEPDPRDTARMADPVTARGQHEDTAAGRQQPDLTTGEAGPAEHAVLVVQRGPRAGERVPLDVERALAGRHPGADIFLDDVTVSRKHAEFLTHKDGHLVRDVGSLNGTYVNDERVDSTVLHAGDEVQIGKYRFTYQPDPEPA